MVLIVFDGFDDGFGDGFSWFLMVF